MPRGELQAVWTLQAIADHFGIHLNTARKWIRNHGLPACYGPDGRWLTTRRLLDDWIIARQNIQRRQWIAATQGPPKPQEVDTKPKN